MNPQMLMMGMQMMPMLMQMNQQQQMMGQQQMNQNYSTLPGMFTSNQGQNGMGYDYEDMLKTRESNNTPWYQKLFNGLSQIPGLNMTAQLGNSLGNLFTNR
jgi:hypothetical protein